MFLQCRLFLGESFEEWGVKKMDGWSKSEEDVRDEEQNQDQQDSVSYW